MSSRYTIAVRDSSKATGSARAIMYALASRANKSGECWPGLSTIARDAGTSRASVVRALPKLAALGEIHIQHGTPSQDATKATPNIYKITLQTRLTMHLVPGSPCTYKIQDKMRTRSKHRGQDEQWEEAYHAMQQILASKIHMPPPAPATDSHA